MRIKVMVPLALRRSQIDERGWIEVPEGTTLSQLVHKLGLPGTLLKALFLSVNGIRVPLSTELKDGDVVSIIAPLAGG